MSRNNSYRIRIKCSFKIIHSHTLKLTYGTIKCVIEINISTAPLTLNGNALRNTVNTINLNDYYKTKKHFHDIILKVLRY